MDLYDGEVGAPSENVDPWQHYSFIEQLRKRQLLMPPKNSLFERDCLNHLVIDLLKPIHFIFCSSTV